MAKKGDKFVLTIGEVIYGQSGKRLYLVDGFNSLVFDEEGLKRLDVLPFATEDLTLGSIVDNPDPGIIQRYLEFAKETGRDFHLTITAEGETSIDLTVPTKTVTESKYYSIPGRDEKETEDCEEETEDWEDESCPTCEHYDSESGYLFCRKCARCLPDEYKKRV